MDEDIGSLFVEWRRGQTKPISSHWTTMEFQCRCDRPECVEQRIRVELMDRLERLRCMLGNPILVTSGFRCHAHQMDLEEKGYPTSLGGSQHELGCAADLVAGDMDLLLQCCEKFFKAIGVSRKFIHVDLRDDRPRRWEYPR